MDIIRLHEIFGDEILSRANIKRLYDIVTDDTAELSFANVAFISRSVADELCNLIDAFSDITLSGMSDDVALMLELVKKGRGRKREYIAKPKVSVTYNCRTMDDLRNALL